ncbi:MAG TPA: TlpA disulfide reductase family protein [Kofleriaceae bacterium]
MLDVFRALKRAALVIALAACSSKPAPTAQPVGSASGPGSSSGSGDASAATPSYYRVEASIDELHRVPFIVAIEPNKPEGWIWSIDEKLPLVVESRAPLAVRIPVRGIELRFDSSAPDALGSMKGTWGATYYFKRDFALLARSIDSPSAAALFPGTDAPSGDLTGTLRFDIKDFGVGRGTFRQEADGSLAGTIIPPEVGDLRHLTGRVTGSTLRASAFDGIHGFLVQGMFDKDTLTGTWSVAGIGTFGFTATRDAAPPTHLNVKARMRPGTKRLAIPALDKPPFAGNPVIVDYFGSWCPVCMDLTPELVRLRREHAADGLQVLSISLEPDGDERETAKRLDEFRAAFGITWPFVIKYGDDFAAGLPPELVDATGFPVTIFLRRDHAVAAVHTGFVSTASPTEHAEVVTLFDQLTADITRGSAAPDPHP